MSTLYWPCTQYRRRPNTRDSYWIQYPAFILVLVYILFNILLNWCFVEHFINIQLEFAKIGTINIFIYLFYRGSHASGGSPYMHKNTLNIIALKWWSGYSLGNSVPKSLNVKEFCLSGNKYQYPFVQTNSVYAFITPSDIWKVHIMYVVSGSCLVLYSPSQERSTSSTWLTSQHWADAFPSTEISSWKRKKNSDDLIERCLSCW